MFNDGGLLYFFAFALTCIFPIPTIVLVIVGVDHAAAVGLVYSNLAVYDAVCINDWSAADLMTLNAHLLPVCACRKLRMASPLLITKSSPVVRHSSLLMWSLIQTCIVGTGLNVEVA